MSALKAYVPTRPTQSPPYPDTGYFVFINGGATRKIPGGGLQAARRLTTKTLNYTLLTTDAGNVFDNTGAGGIVILTLPPWVADPNLKFYFMVTAAQMLRIKAPSPAKIANDVTNSAAAGYIQNNQPFCALCLVPTSVVDQWAVESATGNWGVL